MTTTRMSNGETVKLTIEQKARLLTVFSQHPDLAANELAVTSGTAKGCAYVVTHNGRNTTHCTCNARIEKCAHRVAGNWFLEAQNRATYDTAFNPANID